MYTSVPSIAITIVLFLVIGYCYGDYYVPANTEDFIEALDSAFNNELLNGLLSTSGMKGGVKCSMVNNNGYIIWRNDGEHRSIGCHN
ncbi:hypothetical protein [Ichthyobacterium seriolicida]|uniref:hypothetical protein n=1 Tax=Ichthyobacterium seriolicida TaxID=242600 RepID=UPI00374488F6